MGKKVLIEAAVHNYVGYFGFEGQIDRGYPLEERPEEPPTGSVYEREYVLLKDAVDEEGKTIERLNGFPLKAGPRRFLRGRVVTDQEEATALLMPPFLRELVRQLGELVEVEVAQGAVLPTVVAVRQVDGTEVGILLRDKDTAPLEGVSPYPIGESPEEIEAAEIEQIREDAKNGVYDDEEEAAVGGGHPVIPFSDDGPRAA